MSYPKLIRQDVYRNNASLQHTLRVTIITLALFLFNVNAWGKDGHKIIADIAATKLEPKVLSAVIKILAVDGESTTMGDVSSWVDVVIHTDEYRWSAPLHFTNVRQKDCGNPYEGYNNCTYNYERDCVDRDGNNPGFCNVGAILNYTKRLQYALKNGDHYVNETLDSLKFLIHFVGDISQPLHSGMLMDLGGLEMNVVYYVPDEGSNWSLHNVWDFGLITNKEGIEVKTKGIHTEITKRMDSYWKDEVLSWSKITDPNKWAQDSLNQAMTKAYRFANGTQIPKTSDHGAASVIPQSYYDAYMCEGCAVELQLAKGAIRLSTLLNSLNW